ncbi:MAG: hypothetical protein AAGF12_34530, partial [Myxococcota bacterium]
APPPESAEPEAEQSNPTEVGPELEAVQQRRAELSEQAESLALGDDGISHAFSRRAIIRVALPASREFEVKVTHLEGEASSQTLERVSPRPAIGEDRMMCVEAGCSLSARFETTQEGDWYFVATSAESEARFELHAVSASDSP